MEVRGEGSPCVSSQIDGEVRSSGYECHLASVSSFVVAQKLLQSSLYLNVSAGHLPLTIGGHTEVFSKFVGGCP